MQSAPARVTALQTLFIAFKRGELKLFYRGFFPVPESVAANAAAWASAAGEHGSEPDVGSRVLALSWPPLPDSCGGILSLLNIFGIIEARSLGAAEPL